MRTSNPDRLTAATAEQLLDGGPGPAGLSQLLAAAAGPGTASELAGETAAVAAFVDAPRANPLPSAQVRRPSMLSTALSKILAAKALATVVLLAGAGGGVALAANASQSSSSSTDETSVTSTETAEPGSTGDDAVDPDADATTAAGATPEPSIAGLCKAWAAGATDNPGKAAENPAFRSLVEAAGSEEDVPGFCADRERTDPGRSATAPGRAEDGQGADPTDGPGNSAGRGTPPATAPGNPDHPAGPKADRANGDGEDADSEENDSKSAGSGARDGGDDDREGDSGSARTQSEQGGQGRGGESADHRQND